MLFFKSDLSMCTQNCSGKDLTKYLTSEKFRAHVSICRLQQKYLKVIFVESNNYTCCTKNWLIFVRRARLDTQKKKEKEKGKKTIT